MDTGLYYGLRFFEFSTGLPELTDNDFFCKQYTHREYVVLNPKEDKLLPFGFKFPAAALGIPLNKALIEAFMVCKDTGVYHTIVLNPSDWLQTETDDAVYVHHLALQPFTAKTALYPGLYYLLIDKVILDNEYRFYSDTFILKRHIPATP